MISFESMFETNSTSLISSFHINKARNRMSAPWCNCEKLDDDDDDDNDDGDDGDALFSIMLTCNTAII
jgi:hypothetical protein